MTNSKTQSHRDMAIAILGRTCDGNELAPHHLKLTKLAVNGQLSEHGIEAFEELHRQVMSGEYAASRFSLFGIAHLTRDSAGYVYWRGKHVEHYSHQSQDAMHEAALRLAKACESLEQRGFDVNSRTAICQLHAQAPADTPWKEALGRFYSLFESGNRRVAILYRYAEPDVTVLERDAQSGELREMRGDSAYDAFHFVQGQGLVSNTPRNDYAAFCRFMEQAKLTPQDIHAALT